MCRVLWTVWQRVPGHLVSYSASRISFVCWCSSVYMTWHSSISPSYVYRSSTSRHAASSALPLEDNQIFLGTTWKTMADGHSRTPALTPGTHCQNICDKLLQLIFSGTLWKRFYSGRYRVQSIRDILMNGIYKFTYLLTYTGPATKKAWWLNMEHWWLSLGAWKLSWYPDRRIITTISRDLSNTKVSEQTFTLYYS